MLRHSVLWTLRPSTTPAQRREMLRRLAYLRAECRSVSHGDYGEDVFGGSRDLRLAPPAERTRMWRREGGAPPASFDVALHVDFADLDAAADYSGDPVHAGRSRFNEAVSWDELTARVDWWYDGDPPSRRGHIRHTAMFAWADGASEDDRAWALEAVERLGRAGDVERVTVGHGIGKLASDYDWILDVQLPDRPAAERFLSGVAYASAVAAVRAATKFEWTARVTHVMRAR